jgi:hypothetical protein
MINSPQKPHSPAKATLIRLPNFFGNTPNTLPLSGHRQSKCYGWLKDVDGKEVGALAFRHMRISRLV